MKSEQGQQIPQDVITTQVNFSNEAYDTLLDVAEQSDRTMSEVLGDGIAHLGYVTREQNNGATFYVLREKETKIFGFIPTKDVEVFDVRF